MFTQTYETRYSDYKDFDTLKPCVIMDVVQDISILHSEKCGYGLNALRELNMAWLLLGIKVRFEDTLKTGVPLEVSTAVKRMKGATSERGCIIKQGGKVVAKTIANWFTFDSLKMKICKIPQDMGTAYEPYDFEDEFFNYAKPDILESPEVSYTVKVCNKEIDTNNHLNNKKAADLLTDALPFDFNIKEMTLLYKTPAYLGDILNVCVEKTEKGYYVMLRNSDNDICVAGMFEGSSK